MASALRESGILDEQQAGGAGLSPCLLLVPTQGLLSLRTQGDTQ